MKIDLKWRGLLILAVLLLCIFFVGPSVLEDLPGFWKSNARRISLGLDLRGGAHLLLQVKVEEAVRNSVVQISGDLKELLVKEKIRFARMETKDRDLEVVLLKPEQEGDLMRLVSKQYPGLTKLSSAPEDGRLRVRFQLSQEEAARIRENAVRQAVETIRNRLDPEGVKEHDIVAQGEDRILVQLPGVENVEHAKEMIKRVALLEFKIVDREHSLEEALRGNVPPDSEILYTSKVDPQTRRRTRGEPILVKKQTLLTGDMLDQARVEFEYNMPRVAISFDSRGAKLFDQVAEANVGKELAIILDGTVYSHPVIKQRHYGGRAVIEGSFTPEEARDLVVVLKAGSLPAPVEVEEERTVGPSLGRDSIQAGIVAGLVGAVAVVIFMVVYYGAAGVIADLALAINVLIVLAAMAALKATLTLPGIAGIILGVGMAVDANVLIFERIREELRGGKPFKLAVDSGFSRAFSAIFDSNLTTLIAAALLFQFGTGPLRGFAVTLCIGLVANLFTAVWVSRTIVDYMVAQRRAIGLGIQVAG
ncbi:MAG: protein translocase subunit SecD [Thermodesulfobacteriota bacterium]